MNNINRIYFTDDVRACKDLWLVGDDFLKEMSYTLRAMKNSSEARPSSTAMARGNITREPYIHKQYNVRPFTSSKKFSRENVLARINNSFVKALNENPILPKAIVFVLGDEILKLLNYNGYGISMMIGKTIYWLINKISRHIETCREALTIRKPGALTPGEPKIVWLNLLTRPGVDQQTENREKFNSILKQATEDSSLGMTMAATPEDRIQYHWFDLNGNMTHEGRTDFWSFFSDQILRFDMEMERQKHEDDTVIVQAPPHINRNFLLPAPPAWRENDKKRSEQTISNLHTTERK